MALPTDTKSFEFKFKAAMIILMGISVAYCSIPSAEEQMAVSGPDTMKGSEAFEACRPQIESTMLRPETVDFNLFDTTISNDGTNARFSITGAGENAFGTAMKFTAFCVFQNGTLASVEVAED